MTPPGPGKLLVRASYAVIHTNASVGSPMADCLFSLKLDATTMANDPARTINVWPGSGTSGYCNGIVASVFDVTGAAPVAITFQGRSDNDAKTVSTQRASMTVTFIPD